MCHFHSAIGVEISVSIEEFTFRASRGLDEEDNSDIGTRKIGKKHNDVQW